ncbi:MAG TPA: WecB/TagA/CpsF family glycosyltransferase [Roseimicrobium sp.]|nr:WecB/TagA/CpsF family glycosyltransferase [Roseimicrobium sp.]
MDIQRVNVLGVGISILNMQSAMAAITAALEGRRKGYICVTGVHGVMESQWDPDFRQILNRAFLCTPDGMPMVWLGRFHGHKEMGRVYGPDLMLEVCRWSAANPCRHFFFGGVPGVAEELRDGLTARFPGMQTAGCYTPPFRPMTEEEMSLLMEQVRVAGVDILWVGLSTPKQEKFMRENLSRLDATLMIGVGAAFDILSGRIRQAPLWMRRIGLEWLFRLWSEPRRLWRRYCFNNPRFVLLTICQLLGIRRFRLD